MRSLFLVIALLIPSLLSAQTLKERRVYYLDCTYSMVTNNIWDRVRDNLKQAIDNVEDETTELIVIPFTDKGHPLSVNQQRATLEGKKHLKGVIDNLEAVKNCNTNHWVPLLDFYDKRVDASRVTYMFLMTDGRSNQNGDEFQAELEKWSNRYGRQNVYGFYVMLVNSAKNPSVENIINGQEHLWKVESADVNVNLIRLDTKAVFNVRNDKYVDVPVHGNANGIDLTCQLVNNPYYNLSSLDLRDGRLRLSLQPKLPTAQLPQDVDLQLNVAVRNNPKFTYLVTDHIIVTCKNKKEYSLKVFVK